MVTHESMWFSLVLLRNYSGHLVNAELVVLSAGGPNSDVALPFPHCFCIFSPTKEETFSGH